VKRDDPHRVSVLQLRRLQRVSGITVQRKPASQKEKPRKGTDLSRGHIGSMNSGLMLRHVSQRDAWIKGTTLESLRRVILAPLLRPSARSLGCAGGARPKPTPHCYNACMTKGSSYCFECKRPLVEIDNRGHHLRGCLTCNIWWSLRGGGAVKLSVEDLYALQQLKRTK
jgi:hypothetical protein